MMKTVRKVAAAATAAPAAAEWEESKPKLAQALTIHNILIFAWQKSVCIAGRSVHVTNNENQNYVCLPNV